MTSSCWTADEDGLVLAVRVTPRGGRDGLGGYWQDKDGRAALLARVSAAPVDGAANAALEMLVAKAFGVRRRDVTVIAGTSSRQKRLKIVGNTYNLATKATELSEGIS